MVIQKIFANCPCREAKVELRMQNAAGKPAQWEAEISGGTRRWFGPAPRWRNQARSV